jgi:hypothetical protein
VLVSDDTNGRDGRRPPAHSRLDRGGVRPYRTLTRPSDRASGRDRRQRQQRPIAELVGLLVRSHGLTDEVRQRVVCLYWPEIAGGRIGSKTVPVAFGEGVLHLSAKSSAWVHEMQFFKLGLIARINDWVETNRVWLGSPPLVMNIRIMLGTQRREVLVDPEQVEQLRMGDLRRTRPAEAVPRSASDGDRASILAEASVVEDDELRAMIENVRTRWNK